MPISLRELSVDERLELIEQIWQTIAADPEEIELTDDQREELYRRVEAHQQNPDEGYTWEEVRRSIEQRK